MKKGFSFLLFIVIGAAALAVGLLLGKRFDDAEGIMAALPYILIGVGCGLFGHGMGGAIEMRAMKRNPELEKRIEVERNDERNTAIANRAKGKAYDMMIFVYGALMVCFALMDVELAAVLLLVFAYLLVVGCNIYYRVKYDREM